MDIFLSINNREQVIQLPIVPEEFQIENANKNETFETIQQGDLNLIGLRDLKAIAIETFFPNHEYVFAKSKTYTGDEFIEIMESWIGKRVPIRLIITNKKGTEIVNLAVAIESFNYGYDKSGDVAYTLNLKEFRFI